MRFLQLIYERTQFVYLDKLKHKISKILVFTIVIYGVCIIVLYQYYQGKAEIEKAQILQDYYNKIVKVSTNKINSLTQKLSKSLQSPNISININGSDLDICCDKCIGYSLFRFGALIDKYIPEFIYYKIELNKKFLYSNIKVTNYQIEKIYHLNDYNQFSVSLAIDKLYWSKTEAEIKKPFWIMTLFALANILLLYILSKISFKSFNKEYTLQYQNKYKEELGWLKLNYSEELKKYKDSLMNKIWNLNFNKQKDLEINCLLAVEANKIALIDEGDNDQNNMIKGSRLKNSSNKVSCSIVLYQDDKIEEINIAQLIELFTDRFDQENENISVKIISKVKVVYFASKASLYQIIYSLISYLIFIINKQSPTTKHDIRLIIDDIEKVIQLHFEYDGFPITEEKELESKDEKDIDFLTTAFSGYPILIVQGAQLLNQVKGLYREEYKKKIQQSADKIKLNVTLAIKELKPSAGKLLYKIALINNQSFSKQLLNAITNDPTTISDDIYQLSKFMLIPNTDYDENNPVFEMHDVIAQKILETNGDNNKKYLEDTITKLMNAIPKSVIKGRIFRNAKTMLENFEVISKNAEKYDVSIYKIMGLNLHLVIQHINSLDYYDLEDKINWFNKNDQEGKFKSLLISNDEKARYATYLELIGTYYKRRCADNNTALRYYTKALQAFDNVKYYESYKFSTMYQLAVTYAELGQIQEAAHNVRKLEEMLNSSLVDKGDISFTYIVKTRLLFMQGKYLEGLEQVDKFIKTVGESGLNSNDLFFTNPYMLKAEILNALGKYQEAYAQIEQLYNMHKSIKKENHEIFGRIHTQMARIKLGQGEVKKAFAHINKAITIFLGDEYRNPKDADYSEDPDLAASYVVQGDIFFVQDNFKQAIESYKKAQIIYFYLYRDRSKNVAHVSYLYTQGAKVACKAKDLYNYKAFGKHKLKNSE